MGLCCSDVVLSGVSGFSPLQCSNNMKEYQFELEMKVRDYECDLQCIVNNANYQHYMEHARHEFLEKAGANFGALHNRGIDAVVARVEIDYL